MCYGYLGNDVEKIVININFFGLLIMSFYSFLSEIAYGRYQQKPRIPAFI